MISETAEGNSRIFVRLLDEGGWKFHDIYLVESNGRQINMMMSEVQENPLIFMGKYFTPEIKKTLSFSKDAVEAYLELKKSQEPRRGASQKEDTSGLELLHMMLGLMNHHGR
jgi:hypothetical protein